MSVERVFGSLSSPTCLLSSTLQSPLKTRSSLSFRQQITLTRSILLYVEGIHDARGFVSTTRAAASVKPIIVLKAGRHATDERVAMSHTGALVGNDAVFDAALRRAGAIRVPKIGHLFAAAETLANGRLPRGKLAILDGDPGLGKSTCALDLAARVTLGALMPDGSSADLDGPAGVVIMTAEDGLGDTVRPRLEAAGADLERVHIVHAIRDGFNSAGDELQRAFSLKEDVQRLEAVLQEIGDVRLIVIDPISAYIGSGTDSHNNAEVRTLLSPLGAMAARRGVAVIAVSHLNKGGAGSGGDALLREGQQRGERPDMSLAHGLS